MPKRTFDHVEPSSPTLPPSSSPSKKIHASTPASRSTATATWTNSSAFSTPYTPSVYSIPADSPTNPLGLKRRVHNLTLPKPTPFSRHVALRFQLVSTTTTAASPGPSKPSSSSLWDSPSPSPANSPPNAVRSKNPAAAQYAREGTYRIVQAPLSYTFRHLRALILFLFSCDPAARRDRTRVPGHLFAVHHGISIRAPGEIARGRVRVKLSRARDPYYSSRSLADLIAAADAQGQGEEDLEDEEEDASWRWEGEDDFTLGHVWEVRVRNPKHGIVYYHDDTTTVHITLNAQTVPHRKGVGNMPFVFRAYGDSHIDPPLLPRSPSASPTTTTTNQLPAPAPPPRPPRIFPTYKRPTKAAAPTALASSWSTTPLDGPGDTDVDGDAFSSDEDDYDGGLDTRAWNHTGAFPRFLAALRGNAPSSSSSSSSASASPSPSAPPSPSSPVRTSLSSSSPTRTRGVRRAATMPYSAASSTASLSLPSSATHAQSISQSLSSPPSSSPTRSLPSLTPAPARARTRYRVARAARRLLGLAERGLESAAAEEADVGEGRVQGLSKKGGGSSKGDGRKGKTRSERDAVKSRPKMKTKTATGEVWNPFAHLKDTS